jgi:hypothetical protein
LKYKARESVSFAGFDFFWGLAAVWEAPAHSFTPLSGGWFLPTFSLPIPFCNIAFAILFSFFCFYFCTKPAGRIFKTITPRIGFPLSETKTW